MFQWWGDAEHQGQQLPSPPAETAGTYSVFIPCDLALSYQYSECAHASTVDWVQSMKSELKPPYSLPLFTLRDLWLVSVAPRSSPFTSSPCPQSMFLKSVIVHTLDTHHIVALLIVSITYSHTHTATPTQSHPHSHTHIKHILQSHFHAPSSPLDSD